MRKTQFTGRMRAFSAVSAVGNLGLGNDHHGEWIAIETAIVNISDDTDDLARRLFKLGPYSLANHDLLAHRVLLSPKLSSPWS